MKKLLSTILCLAMMLSLATPALAASSTTASGIRGEIIYQEGGNSLSRSSPTVIVSSVKNQDGSYTICQYSNGVLQEEHTTVPGSGFVSSKIYNADGSVSPSQKLTRRGDVQQQVAYRTAANGRHKTHHIRSKPVEPLGRGQAYATDGKGKCANEIEYLNKCWHYHFEN